MSSGPIAGGASGVRKALFDSRIFLLFTLGGLLALLGFSAYRVQTGISEALLQGELLRLQFAERSKVLNQLRSDIVMTGTFVRDFLLDPEVQAAEGHRRELLRLQKSIGELLASPSLGPSGGYNSQLRAEYEELERSLDPILTWPPELRRKNGYLFVREVVFPRRTALLALAEGVGKWNQEELERGAKAVNALFEDLKFSLFRQAILLLILGVTVSGIAYWKIRSLEREATARLEEARSGRALYEELSLRLVTSQEEERKRISRELHDEVAQNLSAAKLEIERLQKEIGKGPLQTAYLLTDASLKATRNMSLLLRPSMLDDLGLGPALDWLARESMRRSQVSVRVEADEDLEELPEALRLCVYRVAQEALNNAISHSGCSSVVIRVRIAKGVLRLSVEDNGMGFDCRTRKGLGRLGMEERVHALGGKFEVESQTGVGTVVLAVIPYAGVQ